MAEPHWSGFCEADQVLVRDLVKHAENKCMRTISDAAQLGPPAAVYSLLLGVGIRLIQAGMTLSLNVRQGGDVDPAHPQVIAGMRAAGQALGLYPDEQQVNLAMRHALLLASGVQGERRG